MSTRRINISLSDKIEQRAKEVIEARGFSGLSDLLAVLIREEYERRHPPALHESPTPYRTAPARRRKVS